MNYKILYFPAWYPNHINPIAGQCVRQHAHVLKDQNEIAIFYTFGDFNLDGLIQFKEGWEDGLLVYRSFYKRYPYKLLSPVNFLLYLLAMFSGYLKVRKKFGRPDLNHVHVLTKTALIPFLLKCINGTSYVITEHWSRYLPERNSYKGLLRKALTRLFVKHSSGISAVSPNLKKALVAHKLTKQNFPLIFNTINSEKFFLKHASSESKPFRFLHVSGMQDNIKNISGMIEACIILKQQASNFEFHFVGDSEEVPRYKKTVEENGLAHNVFFHGHIDEGLVEFYHIADAFVIFSYFENQPMVIIESFLCGTPVIASNAGGMPEMITEENGLLVESNNARSLAGGMARMIKGEVRHDKKRIRELAIEKYSEKAVAQQLLNFYATALNSPD